MNTNKKKHKSIATLQDAHLNYDGKNYVYSDIFTKDKGYILTSAETEKYALYSSRFMLGLSIGILIFFTMKNIALALVLGIVTFLVLEITFRKNFLTTLPVVENYKRPSRINPVRNLMNKYSMTKLILLAVFSGAIAILIPINCKISNYEGYLLYANYLIAIGMLIYLIFVIIAIIIKALENKK